MKPVSTDDTWRYSGTSKARKASCCPSVSTSSDSPALPSNAVFLFFPLLQIKSVNIYMLLMFCLCSSLPCDPAYRLKWSPCCTLVKPFGPRDGEGCAASSRVCLSLGKQGALFLLEFRAFPPHSGGRACPPCSQPHCPSGGRGRRCFMALGCRPV